MANSTRRMPYRPTRLRSPDIDRLFDDFFAGLWTENDAPSVRVWAPRVDISEGPKDYLVSLDLPGLSRDEVTVDVQHHQVTVHGRRTPETTDERRYLRMERRRGRFYRVIRLPADAQADQVEAAFADGVLTLRIPKTGGEAPHRISIG